MRIKIQTEKKDHTAFINERLLSKIHFLAVDPREMAEKGMDPTKQIVPSWFGLKAELEQVPESCPVKVSGRSQFKLFVNGTEVVFGPLRGIREIAYYDELDLASYLKTGENHLLMQVLSYPEHPVSRSESGPNYCYGDDKGPAVAWEGRIGDCKLGDPGNWYTYIDPAMRFQDYATFLAGAMEEVDGIRRQENPFLQETWDLSSLPKAVHEEVIDVDPFGCRHAKSFEPRPIPLLYRREKDIRDWETTVIPPNTSWRIVLDAEQLTTAYFRIGFSGGKGSLVRMTYAESYFQTGADGKPYKGVRDDTSGYIDGVYDDYLVGGGEETYEPFRFRTFRFIELEAETKEEALTIRPLPYIETAYPLENKRRPQFADARKEKLYDVALRTLQLCMHDTYEDCPYYEQLMYACDSRLEMLFTYACSGDTRLPAYCIDLWAKSMLSNGFTQARFPSREVQIIPVFSLYFIMMLEDYINETGDLAKMSSYIPLAERIVEIFLAKKEAHGMIAPQGYWDYFDWTEKWAARFSVPTAAADGCSALQNLFFVYALQALIRLLRLYHRESLADYYQREAEVILRNVEAYCYDAERGLYREGPVTDEYSQHSQIFAVLTGLADGEKAQKMMNQCLDEDLIPCSFMQGYYLFRALEKAGLYHRTEELWKKWEEFIDLHCTTFPETPFDPRSDCHAWSALPLYEFSRMI